MKGIIRPANRQRYLSFLDRLPLDYTQLIGREAFNRVALLCIFTLSSYILISIFECIRGLLPGMVAVPMLILLIISILIGLMTTLQENAYLKQQITEQSSNKNNKSTANNDVRTAFAAGTFMSLLAFIALFVIYDNSNTNIPAFHPPSSSVVSHSGSEFDNEHTVVTTSSSTFSPDSDSSSISSASSSSSPFLDLGASLRYGLMQAVARTSAAIGWISMADAAVPNEPAKIALFIWIILISILLGFTCALLFDPAIRIARCYHDLTLVDPIEESRMNRLNSKLSYITRIWNYCKELPSKSVLFFWFYGPLLLSMLWYPNLFSSRLIPKPLVRCSPTSIARDCWPDGTPFYNTQQNQTLTFSSLFTTISPYETPVNPNESLPLTFGIKFSESGWLQARIVLVLIFVALHVVSLRKFITLSLRNAREGQVDLILAIAQQAPNRNTRVKQEKFETIENRSGYSEEKLRSFGEACQAYAAASIRNIMVYSLHLLAPIALFGAISLLILRLGYLENGIGVCTTCRYITRSLGGGWIIDSIAQHGPPKADAFERLLELLGKGSLTTSTTNMDGSITATSPIDTLRAGREALTILTSAFWRPVLSFSLWFLLVAFFIMQEMGFIFFRFISPLARAERAKASIDMVTSSNTNNNNNNNNNTSTANNKNNSRKQK